MGQSDAGSGAGSQGARPRGEPRDDGDKLQKVMAQAGVGSRRVCEDLIAAGKVTVNGEPAPLGQRVRAATDLIVVEGVPLPVREGLAYYLVNKPAGVVSSAAAQDARPLVVDLVPPAPRVYPVGRLDAETEGLIVLTNDGDLAQALSHPSFGVEKEYVARLERALSADALRRLRRGVELEDGPTAPAKVRLLGPATVRVVIHEGRNRQVRRMCEAVGNKVTYLARTRIGPLAAPEMLPGHWRQLSVAEITSLWRAALAGAPGDRRARRAGSRHTG
jgi:23S rRNA pseudouridine2605 synthase